MIEIIDPKYRYYVYTLAYPDGIVFYVGKGSGGRILNHEGEAQRTCKCKKCIVIRGIWENGGKVKRRIVFRTNDENEAFLREQRTIQELGYTHLCNYDFNKQRIPQDVLEYRQMVVKEMELEKKAEQDVRRWRYEQGVANSRQRLSKDKNSQ